MKKNMRPVTQRKIAANYLFVPGYPLLRNGYVVVEDGRVVEAVDTGGVMREIPRLEFYGGLLVNAAACDRVAWREGDDILDCLRRCYDGDPVPGLALIEGADFVRFRWTKTTRITRLR